MDERQLATAPKRLLPGWRPGYQKWLWPGASTRPEPLPTGGQQVLVVTSSEEAVAGHHGPSTSRGSRRFTADLFRVREPEELYWTFTFHRPIGQVADD